MTTFSFLGELYFYIAFKTVLLNYYVVFIKLKKVM